VETFGEPGTALRGSLGAKMPTFQSPRKAGLAASGPRGEITTSRGDLGVRKGSRQSLAVYQRPQNPPRRYFLDLAKISQRDLGGCRYLAMAIPGVESKSRPR